MTENKVKQKKAETEPEEDKAAAKKSSPEKKPDETAKKEDKKDALKEVQEQLEAEKDKVLRLSAEFENYKKRKQRELDEFKKFANETLFKQLLGVVDNLERAIDSAKGDKAAENQNGLLEGVALTHKEILKFFETFNVKPVEAENQSFDPNFHQAVTQEETDRVPENTVTTVLQKGYLYHDRLIRPAMVVVSKAGKKDSEQKN